MPPLNFTTTDKSSVANGVKILTYGESGIGKTALCSTAPAPFLISAEGGELSIREFKIPMAKVTTVADLVDLHQWCQFSHHASHFETICIDSVTEIAETVLANAKIVIKDGRQIYGALFDQMLATLKGFRDLTGKHVYMTAQMEHNKDPITGVSKYGPAMPGQKLGPKSPYLYDEVFYMGVGQTPQGVSYRYLGTQPTLKYHAKDRSGVLAPIEQPNLTYIINKILGK
jgi:hypothetical protein